MYIDTYVGCNDRVMTDGSVSQIGLGHSEAQSLLPTVPVTGPPQSTTPLRIVVALAVVYILHRKALSTNVSIIHNTACVPIHPFNIRETHTNTHIID
jgi:hypothetical protein